MEDGKRFVYLIYSVSEEELQYEYTINYSKGENYINANEHFMAKKEDNGVNFNIYVFDFGVPSGWSYINLVLKTNQCTYSNKIDIPRNQNVFGFNIKFPNNSSSDYKFPPVRYPLSIEEQYHIFMYFIEYKNLLNSNICLMENSCITSMTCQETTFDFFLFLLINAIDQIDNNRVVMLLKKFQCTIICDNSCDMMKYKDKIDSLSQNQEYQDLKNYGFSNGVLKKLKLLIVFYYWLINSENLLEYLKENKNQISDDGGIEFSKGFTKNKGTILSDDVIFLGCSGDKVNPYKYFGALQSTNPINCFVRLAKESKWNLEFTKENLFLLFKSMKDSDIELLIDLFFTGHLGGKDTHKNEIIITAFFSFLTSEGRISQVIEAKSHFGQNMSRINNKYPNKIGHELYFTICKEGHSLGINLMKKNSGNISLDIFIKFDGDYFSRTENIEWLKTFINFFTRSSGKITITKEEIEVIAQQMIKEGDKRKLDFSHRLYSNYFEEKFNDFIIQLISIIPNFFILNQACSYFHGEIFFDTNHLIIDKIKKLLKNTNKCDEEADIREVCMSFIKKLEDLGEEKKIISLVDSVKYLNDKTYYTERFVLFNEIARHYYKRNDEIFRIIKEFITQDEITIEYRTLGLFITDNEDLQGGLLETFEKYSIKFSDFFELNSETLRIPFFKGGSINKIFKENSKLCKCKYYIDCTNTISNLVSSIQNYNFKYLDLYTLLVKLEIVFEFNSNIIFEVFPYIITAFITYFGLFNVINILQNGYDFCELTNNANYREFNVFTQKMKLLSVRDIFITFPSLKSVQHDGQRMINISKLRKSAFFISLINRSTKTTQNEKVLDADELYFKLQSIFTQGDTFCFENLDGLHVLNSTLELDNCIIQREGTLLKNHFELSVADEQITGITNKLGFIYNKEKFNVQIKNILLAIDMFNVEKTNFSGELNKFVQISIMEERKVIKEQIISKSEEEQQSKLEKEEKEEEEKKDKEEEEKDKEEEDKEEEEKDKEEAQESEELFEEEHLRKEQYKDQEKEQKQYYENEQKQIHEHENNSELEQELKHKHEYQQQKMGYLKNLDAVNSLFQQINLQIDCNDQRFNQIIDILSKNTKIIEFCKDKREDDVRNLIEFVEGLDSSVVGIKQIHNLIKITIFFTKVQEMTKVDISFIPNLIAGCQNEQLEKGSESIESVSLKFLEIKDLYLQIVNNAEFSTKIIKNIYLKSKFEINTNKETECIQCIINYYTDAGVEKQISLPDVIELKDKSLLLSNKIYDKTEDSFYNICVNYASDINSINCILELAEEHICKGGTNDFNIVIEVNGPIKTITINNIPTNFEELTMKMQGEINRFTNELYLYYKTHWYFSFIHGRMFQIIMKELSEIKNNRITNKYILNFIRLFSSIEEEIPHFDYNKYEVIPNKINLIITNTLNFMKEIFMRYDGSIERLYSKNIIKTEGYQGIYGLSSSKADGETNVIEWYIQLTNNAPQAQTIGYASESTSIEEIISFIYRCLYCPLNVLFSIIHNEELDLDQRKYIIYGLHEIINKEKHEMKSCLVFIFYEVHSEFIGDGQSINNIHYFRECDKQKYDNKWQSKFFPNINVIHSDATGLGKSEYIKDYSLENNLNYVCFPIGGEFTEVSIIKRLKHLNPLNHTLLHGDLTNTTKNSLLEKILFMFLVTKIYNCDNFYFFIPNDTFIFVELPFGFIDFWKKFPILYFFNKTLISKKRLPQLKVDSQTNSSIQVVCNYLSGLDDGRIKQSNIKIQERINYKIMGEEECSNLGMKYGKIKEPSYYQINSFLSVLANQFKLFSENIYLEVKQLKLIGLMRGQDGLSIRKYLVESLITITQYFTQGAYSKGIENQIIANEVILGEYNEELVNAKSMQQLENSKEIVTFDKIKPSGVFFNEDGQSLSIISTEPESSDEYQQLMKLWNSGTLDAMNKLINYRGLQHHEILEELIKVLHGTMSQNQLQELVEGYVFTADNYIKMIGILLRLRANIPIIMMGETGCGKTSLIRMLAKVTNNSLLIKQIHAGIVDDNLCSFIDNEVIPQAKENAQKKLWVFFDEINTCKSLGGISEIMCKHSLYGMRLPDNIVFIGACNHYRTLHSNHISQGLVKKTMYKVTNLAYSVNPLPHSLGNYVFDFGSLMETDEKRYIHSMIFKPIRVTFHKYAQTNEPNEQLEYILTLALEAIMFSQVFIRTFNDVSSVSLREGSKFISLYYWFMELLWNKTQSNLYPEYLELNFITIQKNAIGLSLYMGYYLRIIDKAKREEYIQEIQRIFGLDNFGEIVRKEQDFLIDRINLGQGIARNSILRENIFALFNCLNTKIPLFIVGKPGCSKSLSVQLLFNAMRGDDSIDEYFKQYPRLYMNCFQGAQTSTSAGILKVFSKAKNGIKCNESSKDMISIVYFDELGLAELSPNNPLKVLNYELENDDDKNDKIGFIGISNWCLDSSKGNRGIFISILDMDKDDLLETSKTICDSFDSTYFNKYQNLFKSLALSYFDYKNEICYQHKELEDFHCSRDFYHLIKIASKKLKIVDQPSGSNQQGLDIGYQSIERNFGGLPFSISRMKEIFCDKFGVKEENNDLDIINTTINTCSLGSKKTKFNYNILNCIKDNISEIDSRFLLIVTKTSGSDSLLKIILDQKRTTFYIGSTFRGNIADENYSVYILNKIRYSMTEDKILVLNDLESIYPSLYDVFNQNFRMIGTTKTARIAVGNTNNIQTTISNNFKCIVLINQNSLKQQDPPFLNRFEKHILSYEIFVNDNHKQWTEEICQHLKLAITPMNKDHKINIDLEAQQGNCDYDEILGLVYQNKEKCTYFEDMRRSVFEIIIPTFSQDLFAFLKGSKLFELNPNVVEEMCSIYKSRLHHNIENYIQRVQSPKHIVYTFSKILTTVNFRTDIVNAGYGAISRDSIIETGVSNFDNEEEIINSLSNYYSDQSKNLLIFKFRLSDCRHMNHIDYGIDNYENSHQEPQKLIIFLVCVTRQIIGNSERNDENNPSNPNGGHGKDGLSHLSKYSQVFIDNINGEEHQIMNLLDMDNNTLYNLPAMISITKDYSTIAYSAISYINYSFKPFSIPGFHKKMTENLSSIQLLKETILDIVQKSVLSYQENGFHQFYEAKILNRNDTDLISCLRKYEKHGYDFFFSIFVIKCENDGGFPNIYSLNYENNQDIPVLFVTGVNMMQGNTMNLCKQISSNPVLKYLGMEVPGSKIVFIEITNHTQEIKEEYLANQEKLRHNNIEDDEVESQLKEYTTKEKNMVGRGNEIIINRQFPLLTILKDREEKGVLAPDTVNLLIEDYYTFFLITYVNFIQTDNDLQGCKGILSLIFEIYLADFQADDNINTLISFNLSRRILFGESNKNIIISILELAITLLSDHNTQIPQLSKIISSNKIRIELTNRNKAYKVLINKPFYFIIESLLMGKLHNKSNLELIPNEDFHPFLASLKRAKNICLTGEDSLWLFSKEIVNLQFYLSIIDSISESINDVKDCLIKGIDFEKSEMELLEDADHNIEGLKIQLSNVIEYLGVILEGKENYSELGMNYLKGKYFKISNISYRKELIALILKQNVGIIKASPILNMIFLPYGIDMSLLNELLEKDDDEIDITDFLMFMNVDNIGINELNSIQNPILNETLLEFFGGNFNILINLIEATDPPEKYNALLLTLFKLSHTYLDNITNNRIEDCNKNISTLFIISFIKRMIFKYVNDLISDRFQCDYVAEITRVLNNNSNSNLFKVLKIYILKVLAHHLSYEALLNFKWDNHQIRWIQEFDFKDNVQNIEHSMINFEKLEMFKNISRGIERFLRGDDRNCIIEKAREIVCKDNLIVGFDVLINQVISCISIEGYFAKNNNFEELFKWLKEDILIENNRYGLSDNAIFLLTSLMDLNKESNVMYTLCDKNTSKDNYEMMLLVFKLGFISVIASNTEPVMNITNPNNNGNDQEEFMNNFIQSININPPSLFQNEQIPWFKSGVSCNIETVMKSSFIPSGEIHSNLLRNYEQIKEFFGPNNTNEINTLGLYLCHCGEVYEIGQCSFPWVIDTCKVCGGQVGGENHKLVENNFRIYRDEQYRSDMIRGNNNAKLLPYKLLSQIEEEVNKIKSEESHGLSSINITMYSKKTKTIRNGDPITYRILQIIIFSNLHLAERLQYLTNIFYSQFAINNMTPIETITLNWSLLKDGLVTRDIPDIFIFFHGIISKISSLISTFPSFLTKDLRDQFETDVNNHVLNAITEYKEYETRYNEENKNYINISPTSMQAIINEKYDPIEYDENFSPGYRNFQLNIYTSLDLFIKAFKEIQGNEIKYPIINNYLIHKESLHKLQVIPLINPFENFVLQRCSYYYRDKAKNLKIKDFMKEVKNSNINNGYNDFEEGFNRMCKDEEIHFRCQRSLPKRTLSQEDVLSYVLNDIGESGYGMYVAGIYDTGINIQNSFINSIYGNVDTESNIKYKYQSDVMKEIPIQSANNSEIINSEINTTNSNYENFLDGISHFSYRKYYNKHTQSINYVQYKNIIFNFEDIEKELETVLLFRKHKFCEKQRFIVYAFECYQGDNSSVLIDFRTKYPQEQLTPVSKTNGIQFIKQQTSVNNEIGFSLQKILFYLEKELVNPETSISTIIADLQDGYNFSKDLIDFMNKNDNGKVNHLFEIYEFIEESCVEEIIDNGADFYRKKISDERKSEIKKQVIAIEENNTIALRKSEVKEAVRKFFSRYLNGKREDSEFKLDENLFVFLKYKEEGWANKEIDNDKLDSDIDNYLGMNVKLEEVISFYRLLNDKKQVDENKEKHHVVTKKRKIV